VLWVSVFIVLAWRGCFCWLIISGGFVSMIVGLIRLLWVLWLFGS